MATKCVSLWLSVIILLYLKQVSGTSCPVVERIMNCNECMRCGGYWCNNPAPQIQSLHPIHCSRTPHDQCSDSIEERVYHLDPLSESTPTEVGRDITVGIPDKIFIFAPIEEIKVKTNSTRNFRVSQNYTCKGVQDCYATVESVPSSDFCSYKEPVSVDITISRTTYKIIYKVACTCECAAVVEPNSMFCNHRGEYSCGVCSCNNKWVGDKCEKSCLQIRGDESEDKCMSPANNMECSGNGVCGPCQSCECYEQGEGAQYYDEDYQCMDLCMNVNFHCDLCLKNTTLGPCNQPCNYALEFVPKNLTSLQAKNAYEQNVWVTCNETVDNCPLHYAAMRTGSMIRVMVIKSCNDREGGALIAASGNGQLPVILGLLAAFCLVAAAMGAGYVAWQRRVPAAEALNATVHNFDAQDCTGRNPLYKPPTSFFKNPTYGKLM